MDINDLRSALTLLAFVSFLGIVFWAYHGKSRKKFEEAAQLPFADEFADRFDDKTSTPGRAPRRDQGANK
jgi:cytochrome c oxidase cbb3-type subunit IV